MLHAGSVYTASIVGSGHPFVPASSGPHVQVPDVQVQSEISWKYSPGLHSTQIAGPGQWRTGGRHVPLGEVPLQAPGLGIDLVLQAKSTSANEVASPRPICPTLAVPAGQHDRWTDI
jgi:hypothetical protein